MQSQEADESITRPSGGLLGGWISRTDLALQLGVSEDTLRRWDVLQSGPPCIRAGRKIYYRRTAVLDWLEEQETANQRRSRTGRSGGRR